MMTLNEVDAKLAKARLIHEKECGGRNGEFIALLEQLRGTMCMVNNLSDYARLQLGVDQEYLLHAVAENLANPAVCPIEQIALLRVAQILAKKFLPANFTPMLVRQMDQEVLALGWGDIMYVARSESGKEIRLYWNRSNRISPEVKNEEYAFSVSFTP